jgi:predicted transcriptional regulator
MQSPNHSIRVGDMVSFRLQKLIRHLVYDRYAETKISDLEVKTKIVCRRVIKVSGDSVMVWLDKKKTYMQAGHVRKVY